MIDTNEWFYCKRILLYEQVSFEYVYFLNIEV